MDTSNTKLLVLLGYVPFYSKRKNDPGPFSTMSSVDRARAVPLTKVIETVLDSTGLSTCMTDLSMGGDIPGPSLNTQVGYTCELVKTARKGSNI